MNVFEQIGIFQKMHDKISWNAYTDKITYSKQCPVSKETYTLTVDAEKYLEHKTSKNLVQDIFPELTPEEREFMLSGITPEEWNGLFKCDD